MKQRPNARQRAVCKTYGGGDYAHFGEDPDWHANLEGCVDTLFRFLMIELSDGEDLARACKRW